MVGWELMCFFFSRGASAQIVSFFCELQNAYGIFVHPFSLVQTRYHEGVSTATNEIQITHLPSLSMEKAVRVSSTRCSAVCTPHTSVVNRVLGISCMFVGRGSFFLE